jgi:anti-sigma B factor antagonist
MELIPPESPDAGSGEPAARSAEPSRVATTARDLRRLTFDVATTPTSAVIRLTGELDVVCADTFKRKLAAVTDAGPKEVVIDLRELTFIDSTGLALLLRMNEMSHDLGFVLSVVTRPDDPPGKIFRMTGTHAILPLVEVPPDLGAG